jgi:hypothetical protein
MHKLGLAEVSSIKQIPLKLREVVKLLKLESKLWTSPPSPSVFWTRGLARGERRGIMA